MRNNKNPLPGSPNIIIATQNNTYKKYVLYIKPLFIKRDNNIFFYNFIKIYTCHAK